MLELKHPELILHCFVCHYDNKTIPKDKCSHYVLEKHKKTFTKYILDYNNLIESDLPKCRICNENSVEILPPVDNPTLSECCSSRHCKLELIKEKHNV